LYWLHLLLVRLATAQATACPTGYLLTTMTADFKGLASDALPPGWIQRPAHSTRTGRTPEPLIRGTDGLTIQVGTAGANELANGVIFTTPFMAPTGESALILRPSLEHGPRISTLTCFPSLPGTADAPLVAEFDVAPARYGKHKDGPASEILPANNEWGWLHAEDPYCLGFGMKAETDSRAFIRMNLRWNLGEVGSSYTPDAKPSLGMAHPTVRSWLASVAVNVTYATHSALLSTPAASSAISRPSPRLLPTFRP
jgi:hypothetical protein